MLIGGISTLIFNGNPLLRFDGYYVLSDLIEIPNLGSRAATNTCSIWCGATPSACARKFRRSSLPGKPAGSGLRSALPLSAVDPADDLAVHRAPVLYRHRARHRRRRRCADLACRQRDAFVVDIRCCQQRRAPRDRGLRDPALPCRCSSLCPLPYSTMARASSGSAIKRRCGRWSMVSSPKCRSGTAVDAETVLVRLEDPLLTAKHNVLQSSSANCNAGSRRCSARPDCRGQSDPRADCPPRRRACPERRELPHLVIKADHAGRFLLSHDAEDMSGHFLRRGDVIGYLLTADEPVIRVVVPQADADLVRRHRPDRRARSRRSAGAPDAGHAGARDPFRSHGGDPAPGAGDRWRRFDRARSGDTPTSRGRSRTCFTSICAPPARHCRRCSPSASLSVSITVLSPSRSVSPAASANCS